MQVSGWFIASLLVSAAVAGPAVGEVHSTGPMARDSDFAEILEANPKFAESASVWIIQYESPKSGQVVEIFEGPAPFGSGAVTRKDGEYDAPAPSDFSDPGSWVGLPDNGTVSWSGNWYGSDGSTWEVSVTWESDGSGTWNITAFSSSLVQPPDDDDGPPTQPE